MDAPSGKVPGVGMHMVLAAGMVDLLAFRRTERARA
jgi:hypothetical protein